MGIQINGQTDTISAIDGSLNLTGAELPSVTNLNATGIVTASSFSGALTGNVTGNVTGNLSGNVTGAINSTGVSTITTLSATSIVGVTTAGITTAYIGAVNDGPLAGFRNFIINGNMAISQRGTSFTTINTYNLDRYRTFGGPINHTITRQDSIATYSPSRYALRAARNSGDTQANELGIAQGIETQNSYALRGKTVTVSFRARCGANFSSASSTLLVRVFTGTGTDENPVSMTSMNADVSQSVTLTTSLQTFSVTGTLSASLTQATLTFSYTATGTAGANDWFEITDVQLEIGNRATPFERRSYGQELALAQRYYCKSFDIETAPANGITTGDGEHQIHLVASGDPHIVVYWPVIMRSSPIVTLYNPRSGGASGQWSTNASDGANARSFYATPVKAMIDNSDVSLSATYWRIAWSASAEL